MARINYDLQNDVLDDTQKVITSTWSDNTNALEAVYTSSTQANFASSTSSGAFFIDVYNKDASLEGAEVQYSVAYGHKVGSGSYNFTNAEGAKGNSPTKVTYNQYRQLVFGDENQQFSFPGDGTNTSYTPDDVYIININRSRYKNNLKPSTLNLTLSGSGIGFLKLTDDSITSTGSAVITNAGRQFNIVSGSSGVRLGSSTVQVTDSGSYGLFYPDSGFIVLNPAALDHHISDVEPDVSQNYPNNNHQKFLNSINGGASFIIDSEEKISSKYYFTRIKNSEFNFTTNPSFIDNSGNLRYSSMENNPKVYITTVGLYNDTNDLVAVAKLSQPIAKDFTKEALIRVKLDY
jgi:hypothetical protein